MILWWEVIFLIQSLMLSDQSFSSKRQTDTEGPVIEIVQV